MKKVRIACVMIGKVKKEGGKDAESFFVKQLK